MVEEDAAEPRVGGQPTVDRRVRNGLRDGRRARHLGSLPTEVGVPEVDRQTVAEQTESNARAMSRRSPPGRSLRQSDEREREVSGIRTWTWRCCCSRRTHPTGQRRYGFVLSVASSFASPNATRYSALDRKPRDRPERTAPSVRSADVNPTGRYRTQVGNRRPCRGSVDAEHRDRNSSHTVRASSIRLKPAHSRTTSPIRGHLLHAECTSRELRRRPRPSTGSPFPTTPNENAARISRGGCAGEDTPRRPGAGIRSGWWSENTRAGACMFPS